MSNCKLSYLFPLLLLGSLLFGSCLREPSYPRLLVEADSAMRWGHYDEADSLLSAYNRAKDNENLSTRRYHQLLQLESKFLRGQSSIDDMLLVDSLENYYGRGSKEKHAKTLAFLADIYHISGDYPFALESLMKAEEEAEFANELWLQGIICKKEGDIYLDQSVYKEMIPYYRQSYELAYITKDTLRMANSAHRMGLVYTYLDQVDSVIYYYEKARTLSKGLPQEGDIVPFINQNLADIYMQIEEYDKAATMMPRDTMNDVGWGYWHYYQNHVDSAIFYFQKALSGLTLEKKSELLHLLAELEEKRGNTNQSLAFAKKNVEIEDSIKVQSQVAATLQTDAQHKIDALQAQLNKSETKKHGAFIFIVLLFVIVLFVAYIIWKQWKLKKATKDAEVAHERLLRQEEERKHRQSRQQIEENNQRINQLEQQLEEARKQNDLLTIQRLELDTEQLRAENANIEATNERKEYLLREFQESLIYQRILINAGKPKFHLRDEEWDTLAEWIDKVHDNFTTRLMALTPLNITERQICYLVKLNLKPSQIAAMLNITDTAISMNRNRLYKKIFHEKGSAKDFDEFIKNF